MLAKRGGASAPSVLDRLPVLEALQFPQGGISDGELPHEAALRCVSTSYCVLIFTARFVENTAPQLPAIASAQLAAKSRWQAKPWAVLLRRRELQEETGMRSVQIVAEHPQWMTYDFPSSLLGRMAGPWRRWRGQVGGSEMAQGARAVLDMNTCTFSWARAASSRPVL